MVIEWQLHDFYLWCLCFVSKIPSPPTPDSAGGEGAAKNRRRPSLLHMDPIYRPTGQGRQDSWHILGSLFRNGRGDWVASHVRERGPPGGHSRPDYWSWSSCSWFLPGPTSSPGPLPGLASHFHPGLGWPPLAPGDSVLPSQSGGPEGRLWLLRDSPENPVTRVHAGEGMCVAEAAV